jgi:peptidoglycan/xylan/chitin deacetylase (PgdA/CDA1 family)
MTLPNQKPGTLMISLDLELRWGLVDSIPVGQQVERFSNAQQGARKLLALFREHNINATWNIVGMLARSSREDIAAHLPALLPTYRDSSLSPFPLDDAIGDSEEHDPSHFAHSLVKSIIETPGQDLASHSYSHYYCLEQGQTAEQFKADIEAAVDMGDSLGSVPKTIAFPRNQINPEYMEILARHGFIAYRGYQNYWAERINGRTDRRLHRRAARLVNSHIPLSGHDTFDISDILARRTTPPYEIPASRLLSFRRLPVLGSKKLQITRIKRDIKYAAKRSRYFHLWWHPHNFGADLTVGLDIVRELIECYESARDNYGMTSKSMTEVASIVGQHAVGK